MKSKMAEWIIKKIITYALPKLIALIIDKLGEALSQETKEKLKNEEPLSQEEVLEIRQEINRNAGRVI